MARGDTGIDVYLLNTLGKNESARLADELISLVPGERVRLRRFGKAYKLAPGQTIPLHEIFIFLRAHKELLVTVGLYAGKKIYDAAIDICKTWVLSLKKEEGHRIFLYGPDDEVVKVVEIVDRKAKSATSQHRENGKGFVKTRDQLFRDVGARRGA